MMTTIAGAARYHLLLAAALCCLTVGALADMLTPDEIIEQTANTIAVRVAADAKQLEASPAELYALVDEVFLPVFDTRYAGQLILGRHRRTATPEQRREFVANFYTYLVRNYASYMLRFRKDNIRVLPAPSGQTNDPKRTVVRTQMRLDDGSTIAVDYSLRLTEAGWLVFDVRIDGISYVQTYRNQFDAEISARGLDAVIARLQAEAQKLSMANPDSPSAAGSVQP